MKKVIFALFALTFFANLAQGLACDDHNNPESKPASGQTAPKGK